MSSPGWVNSAPTSHINEVFHDFHGKIIQKCYEMLQFPWFFPPFSPGTLKIPWENPPGTVAPWPGSCWANAAHGRDPPDRRSDSLVIQRSTF